MKFVFLTQSADTTTYKAPSGKDYVINIGQPFVVEDKQDIEFFSNEKNKQRFKKSGKAIEVKSEDDDFKKELSEIKGLSKKSIDKIISVYGTKEGLVDDINAGYDLESSLTKKQKEVLIKTFKTE